MMSKVCIGWYHGLVFIGLISIIWAQDEAASTLPLEPVSLSERELKYLNERLQAKDHLSRDDAINTILELEHYYTLLKYKTHRRYLPSVLIDLAWHQHILHTGMYGNFSRKHFGIECLEHLPFWSENIHILDDAENANPGSVNVINTYDAVVDIFGVNNVNFTIWAFHKGLQNSDESELPKENIEL